MYFPLKYAKRNNVQQIREFFELDENLELDAIELEDFVCSDQFLRKNYTGKYRKLNEFAIGKKESLMKFLNINSFKQLRIEIRDMVIMNIMAEKWDTYKQVYRIDPDFLEELCNTDDVKIPLQSFYTIPYQCFYIDLTNTKMFAPFIGFFINISKDDKTGLPNVSILRVAKQENVEEEIMYSAYFLAKDMISYNMVTVENDQIFINVDKKKIADDTERPVNVLAAAQGAMPFVENVKLFTIFVFQLIQFLGSVKADIVVDTSEKPRKEKPSKGSPAKRIQTENVGFRYGAAVREYRKKYIQKDVQNNQENKNEDQKERKRPVAHIRRAHWQLYWTGEGRKVPLVKWVAPFMVGGKNSERKTDIVTIHKIKK